MIDEGWLRKCIEQRFADKWDLEKTTSWIFDNLNVAPRKPIVRIIIIIIDIYYCCLNTV